MPTVSDVAAEALGALDSSANLIAVEKWVARRYQALCGGRSRFRHLRHVGVIEIPKLLEVGKATATPGEITITGDADAVAAWTAQQEVLPGAYFKLTPERVWYRIKAFTEGNLQLGSPYILNTDSSFPIANAGYSISFRIFPLHPGVRYIGKFVFPRLRRVLDRMSLQELDASAPDRFRQLGGPMAVADCGVDRVTQRRLVELYGYSNQVEMVYYVYWLAPPLLMPDENIPTVIDADILRDGAIIDIMRWEASRAARKGMVDQAGYWRNEYRAQETRWAEQCKRAIAADRGDDDLTLILRSLGTELQDTDITTAREQVWATRQWPL